MSLKKLTNSNEQLDAILICLNSWSNEANKTHETQEINGIKINTFTHSHEHKEYRKAHQLHEDLARELKAEMDSHTIKLALEYLQSEKLVLYQHLTCAQGHQIDGYRILYKGSVFIENGGFIARYLNDKKNKILEKRNEMYLRYGAIGAAIGGIGYLIWDILKWVKEHYPLFPYL